MLVSIDGGTPRPRSGAAGHGGVGEVAWSPDGSPLAFTAEVDPPRFLVGLRSAARAAARRATDSPRPGASPATDWRWDEEGHLRPLVAPVRRRRRRRGATPRQVTGGDWGVADIAWHPDGRTVAFTVGPRPGAGPPAADHDLGRRRRRADGAREPREVLAPGGWANHPAFSPDGRWVAAIGV